MESLLLLNCRSGINGSSPSAVLQRFLDLTATGIAAISMWHFIPKLIRPVERSVSFSRVEPCLIGLCTFLEVDRSAYCCIGPCKSAVHSELAEIPVNVVSILALFD